VELRGFEPLTPSMRTRSFRRGAELAKVLAERGDQHGRDGDDADGAVAAGASGAGRTGLRARFRRAGGM